MINYRNLTVEELATDDMFRRWVIDPTPEITSFWLQWTRENADKEIVLIRARELVLSVLDIYQDDLSDEQIRIEIEELTRIAESRKEVVHRRFYWPTLWKSAAAVILVAGLAAIYYTSQSTADAPEPTARIHEKPEAMEVLANNSKAEMTVLLSDNSVATLSKGSTIRYPKNFGSGERRIYLTGEAFFDVTKNPKQPFLVYTNETVTKVLGTSFRIKAFDEDNTVLVVVKTGRVSVYPKKEYETTIDEAGLKTAGVVLNPNQQAVFIRKENRLEKGMVLQPQLLSESIVRKEQVFDDKPVTEVLQALQKVYGIVIVYNADMLANCAISAQFDDENLKQRMNAICQAIGASYDMIDGQIVISSKGCI
jgi:transmembrane sensor